MALGTLTKRAGIGAGLAIVVAVGLIATSGQMIPRGGYTVSTQGTCSPGERPEMDANGAWQCRSGVDYRSTHIDFSDDYVATSNDNWINSAQSGTGAAANGASGTTARPGIVTLVTGTTATGQARWSSGASDPFALGSYSSAMFEVVGGWPTLSTVAEEYSDIIGFADTRTSKDVVNGCFLREDRLPVATAPASGTITAGSTNLQCWCCAGGTCTGNTMDGTISSGGQTTINTPISALTLPNTNIYHLRVVVTPPSLAEFYVAGPTSSGVLTKRCQITSNIPTAGVGHVFNIMKSAGTTSREFDVDFAHLSLDLSAARSP